MLYALSDKNVIILDSYYNNILIFGGVLLSYLL